jgi:transposase
MHAYPSDVTRGQFEAVRDIFENARAKTKPRDVELYDVFCGVLYVIRSGCQWRMMPSDLPHWNTVYTYYQIWTEEKRDGTTCLSQALSRINELIRASEERKKNTSYIIVDSKSVKNADTAHEKGYDGGKKISGVKIHAAVDTIGLPHAIFVSTANVGDRAGAIKMFEKNKDNLSDVEKVLVDGGYTGKKFSAKVMEILGAAVEVAKRNELHKFEVIPKRWVVERSFAWLDKCRRLWKNCERKIEVTLQMTILGFICVLIRRLSG